MPPAPEEFVEDAEDIAHGECCPTEAFELVEPVEVLLLLLLVLFDWECVGEVGLFFHG